MQLDLRVSPASMEAPNEGSHGADHGETVSSGRTIRIYAGKMFDSEAQTLLSNRLITVSVDLGLILDVEGFDSACTVAEDENTLDLRQSTVLPGLVDAHVHFFLHPYSEVSWTDQLTQEHLAERTIRATIHAKNTLLAGYTAVRDLGTEGACDADIALRKCISGPDPLIPGPRYFCSSRAIVATGSYGPKSIIHPIREGIDGVMGAEVADGPVDCVRAVRRQIGSGADWIKVYADYRTRSRIADVAPRRAELSQPTFSKEELQAIIGAARARGVKVAAHAADLRNTYDLPFDTLEHGGESARDCWVAEAGGHSPAGNRTGHAIWVPTLSVYYTLNQQKWPAVLANFQETVASGFDRIACGGDTGPFPHGDNALELRLMVSAGVPWQKVLSWATLGGWKCIRPLTWEGAEGKERLKRIYLLQEHTRGVGDNEVAFGVLRRGFAADIIATDGDLEDDFDKAVNKDSVSFVMKGGMIYKRNGKAEL